MTRERTAEEKARRREDDIARRINVMDLTWHRDKIQPLIDSGMSYDDAYVAAGGTIVDLSGEQSRYA